MEVFWEYARAFLCGGALCLIGQLLIDKTKLTPARILVLYVVSGVVLTGLGVYKPLVDFAGAGATVPLTGFGYSLAMGAIEAVNKYGLIGALAGGLGQSVSVSAQAKGAIQIAAAALMLIMALKLLDGFEWLRRFSLTRFFPKRRFTPRSSFGVGLANGLMPCGSLQSMQLYALASGSWLRGAAAMLCFSLGTAPLMLGVGVLSGRLNRRFAKPVRLASAALVILMSLSMLTSGLALAGVGGAAVESAPDGVAVARDGKQTVRTELDYGSYPAITVQAGIPVEWTIHADAEKLNGCNNEIVIPAYGLSVALEAGDNLVTFTPEKAGTVPYSCWMGMIRSSITVEP